MVSYPATSTSLVLCVVGQGCCDHIANITEESMKRKTITIQKGQDPYVEMTALSEYCKQKGWRIVNETVEIAMPKGKELEQFQQDVEQGKIVLVPEQENR